MLVKLTYTNGLSIPVLVRSNQGSGQPLLPKQSLEMTFDLSPDEDGVSDLVIVVEPG